MKLNLKSLSNLSISTKMIVFFLLVGIVPLATVGALAYFRSARAIENQVYSQYTALRDIKKTQVEDYFHKALLDMEIFARSKDVYELFVELRQYHFDTKVRPDGAYDVSTKRYKSLWQEYGAHVTTFKEESGWEDIYMICTAHGHVMYSAARRADLGTNMRYGPYKESVLAKLRTAVAETGKMAVVDFEPYEPNDHKPAAFVGYPVHDLDGKLLGLMAVQISIEQINAITNQASGLGKTGEVYLVGADHLMRSDSRLSESSTVMAQEVRTEAVEEAFQGHSDVKMIEDYRGETVLSAYAPLEISGLHWAILAEIEKTEAFSSVYTTRNWILIIGVLIAVAVVGIAIFISRSMTNPIHRIVNKIEEIVSNNDLTKKVEINRPQPCSNIMGCGHDECPAYGHTVECWLDVGSYSADVHCPKILEGVYKSCHECKVYKQGTLGEMGELANWFNTFVSKVSHIVGQVKTSASQVNTASTNISSASEQLASGAEEQQSQLSEVATTMEQMSAMILEASKNADETRQSAQSTGSTASEGRDVVGKTVEGFKTVASTVEQAAHQIQELNKRSEDIGNVIQVIDEIADQTNLLALNANIEAARAGEAGRGFAVVADEVRKLAERTVNATGEISTMIESIQGDIGGAVNSMETIQNQSKEGLEMVGKSDQSLEEISGSITQVVGAVEQIASSANEQSSGAEEISKNIEGVSTVAKQSASSAQELAASAEQMSGEIGKLNELIEQFKVE
jgi:methyl-accepting chemotaxis protein